MSGSTTILAAGDFDWVEGAIVFVGVLLWGIYKVISWLGKLVTPAKTPIVPVGGNERAADANRPFGARPQVPKPPRQKQQGQNQQRRRPAPPPPVVSTPAPSSLAARASAPPDPEAAKPAAALTPVQVRQALNNPATRRQLWVMSEVFGPPVSRREP
jgi:hypothetical protein